MFWTKRHLAVALLWCWLVALACRIWSQQYTFESFQQAQGLANLSVQDAAIDRSGFLWVATANGLYRRLGSRFERFGAESGLLDRNIQAVYVDSGGRVWVGTANNLYVWDGLRFHATGTTPVLIEAAHGVMEWPGSRMLVIDGSRLLELELAPDGMTRSSRLFFSQEQRHAQPELNEITALAQSSNGTLWFGCRQSLCSVEQGGDRGSVHVWGREAGVGEEKWLAILGDRHGSVWAASKDRILQLTPGASRFVDRTPPGIDRRVFNWATLIEDGAGRILAPGGTGVARWDGAAWQTIDARSGFTNDRITALAIGPDGDPWIGSLNGLSHWVGYKDWEAWSELQGLPSSIVWSVSPQASGEVLIGTVKGPALLDTNRHRTVPLMGPVPWSFGQVGGIAQDASGMVWAGTFAGFVLRIDPTTRSVTPVDETAGFIRRIVADPEGRLWIASTDGIREIEHSGPHPFVRYVAEADAALGKDREVVSIAIGRDPESGFDVWFLTPESLVRYHNGQWSRAKFDFTSKLPKEVGCSPDGTLWVTGTDQTGHAAVWHLTRNGSTFIATALPLPANLREAIPYSLLVDRRGWVWLGTDIGVAGWNGNIWRTFNQESGLIWNDTNRGVIGEGADGSIFIGVPAGLAHLLDPMQAYDPVPISIAVTSVKRGEQVVLPDATLKWGRDPIKFAFATPASWNRNTLVFSYRLLPVDSAWIATPDTLAAYSGLSPGSYRFEVFVTSPETAATSQLAVLSFEILPPWWRTGWCYALYVLAAALLLWVAFWLRTRALIRKREELEALVKERTQELESSRESLRIQATHDALTGLLNRATILADLDQEMQRARRERNEIAVLMADVDHFKHVNDAYGHLAGDAVLRQFAKELSEIIRSYDHVGRYGGEEFLLVLSGVREDEFKQRLSTLHGKISNLGVHFEGHQFVITCSVGVCILRCGDTNSDANRLLSAADKALYKAKNTGRNRFVLADNDDDAATQTSSERRVPA